MNSASLMNLSECLQALEQGRIDDAIIDKSLYWLQLAGNDIASIADISDLRMRLQKLRQHLISQGYLRA